MGKVDILVNNAAVQHDSKTLDDIGPEQIENTFKINVFGTFYMTKAAVKYMECGSSIINTTSITAYRGNEILFDYSCTKGALTTMTRTLATMLVKNGIRVNAWHQDLYGHLLYHLQCLKRKFLNLELIHLWEEQGNQ